MRFCFSIHIPKGSASASPWLVSGSAQAEQRAEAESLPSPFFQQMSLPEAASPAHISRAFPPSGTCQGCFLVAFRRFFSRLTHSRKVWLMLKTISLLSANNSYPWCRPCSSWPFSHFGNGVALASLPLPRSFITLRPSDLLWAPGRLPRGYLCEQP